MSADTPIVTEMQVIPVAGCDSMEMTFSGAHAPYFARNLIIMKDSFDHTGIGEIHGGDYTYKCLTSCIPLVVEQEVGKYRPVLGCIHRGGKQAAGDDGEGIQIPDTSRLKFVVEAKWAIECTLLGLLGQHLDIPVCEPLAEGGQRDQVEVPGHLFCISDRNKTDPSYLDESQSRDPWFRMKRQEVISHEQVVERTYCLQDKHDYRNFKLKGGAFLGDCEIDTVRASRKQSPQGRINIDPNGAQSLEEVIRLRRGVGSILSYVEDPCDPEAGFSSRETMAEFRSATRLLVAINMIATNQRQPYRAVTLEAADIALADSHFWSLEESLCTVALLNNWGLIWGSHSNNHLDIALTIFAYVTAATPGSPTALDVHWIQQDGQNLLKDTPVIENDYLGAPDRPGLSVTLGTDQAMEVNKFHNRMPSHDKDDAMAMQYPIPGWIYDFKKPCLVRQKTL